MEQTVDASIYLTPGRKSAAESASKASRVAANARKCAEDSGRHMVATTKATHEIAASLGAAISTIRVTHESTFETNLQALNARVEAARVGEAGRVFTVPTSNVRALDQRNSDAAAEINCLMIKSRGPVIDGLTLVDEAGRTP